MIVYIWENNTIVKMLEQEDGTLIIHPDIFKTVDTITESYEGLPF